MMKPIVPRMRRPIDATVFLPDVIGQMLDGYNVPTEDTVAEVWDPTSTLLPLVGQRLEADGIQLLQALGRLTAQDLGLPVPGQPEAMWLPRARAKTSCRRFYLLLQVVRRPAAARSERGCAPRRGPGGSG